MEVGEGHCVMSSYWKCRVESARLKVGQGEIQVWP
jgi:hypothetical protein